MDVTKRTPPPLKRGEENNNFNSRIVTQPKKVYKQDDISLLNRKLKPLNKSFMKPMLSDRKSLIHSGLNAALLNKDYKTKSGVSIMKPGKFNEVGSSEFEKYEKISDKSPKSTKQLWSEYLEEIPWTYFATFTTPYEMSLRSARRIMDKYHRKMTIEGRDDWIFWAAEKFKLKDGYHLHALIKTEFPWTRENLWLLWQDVSVYPGQKSKRDDGNVFNRCDVQKRDFKKKAGSYICKYLTKSVSDFDFLT